MSKTFNLEVNVSKKASKYFLKHSFKAQDALFQSIAKNGYDYIYCGNNNAKVDSIIEIVGKHKTGSGNGYHRTKHYKYYLNAQIRILFTLIYDEIFDQYILDILDVGEPEEIYKTSTKILKDQKTFNFKGESL